MPANNNYNRTIPDAPLPVSMLPRPEALTPQDLLLLIQPNNEQGNKTKALTLAMLAAFLGNIQFDEIVMRGEYGRTLTLNGDGWTFTAPPASAGSASKSTQLDNTGLNMHALAGDGSGVTDDMDLDPYSLTLKTTNQGLESKIQITKNGLTFTYQTRNGSQVVTRTATMGMAEVQSGKFTALGLADGSYDFPIYVDTNSAHTTTFGDLLMGLGGASNAVSILCKLKVWRQAYFDKDVEINGDLSITGNKTLSVSGFSQLAGVGLNYMTLSNITQGGNGVWKASAHGPDYRFYNQSASNGNVWWVMNDTGNDINVAYDYHSGSGGGTVDITLAMPADSIAAFLRVGAKWYRWVG